jgi:predicted metal-binding protein
MKTEMEMGNESVVHKSVIRLARQCGASRADVFEASDIPMDKSLASICKDQRCGGYGFSASCPPHVMNPDEFENKVPLYHSALAFQFSVHTDILFGDQRNEVLRVVHETASAIKKNALESGARRAMSIAAGPCKQIFCGDYNQCEKVHGNGRCRHPDAACPSMSGLGISFREISRRLGWDDEQKDENGKSLSAMSGIVMLG